jgi:hypothetical protein
MQLKARMVSVILLVASVCQAALGALGPYCQRALHQVQRVHPDIAPDDPRSLREALNLNTCRPDEGLRSRWAPRPTASDGQLGDDTTSMECLVGNPYMYRDFDKTVSNGTVCCGIRPHFNWVLATCQRPDRGLPGNDGQFCTNLPPCFYGQELGGPTAKINYVAAYQYSRETRLFHLMPESSCGDVSTKGVSGRYPDSGFERSKGNFTWPGGDWTVKYAPSSGRELGPEGPRGVTPPAGLFVLSAQNAFYFAFYMLSQLGINLEKHGNPTGTNCWLWELDAVEGTAGWSGRGGRSERPERFPGNINHLYFSSATTYSGCMSVANSGSQAQGNVFRELLFPELFRNGCRQNSSSPGCHSLESVSWSGGAQGTDRFENAWDQPYLFAVVIDGDGYWTYRFIPEEDGSTPWPGIGQFEAAAALPPRPRPLSNPEGLRTDVRAHVDEAVILQPGLSTEGGCLRSLPEKKERDANRQQEWGPLLLSNVAWQLGKTETAPGSHNWWNYFVSTGQHQGYPASIMGVPLDASERYRCNSRNGPFLKRRCSCAAS